MDKEHDRLFNVSWWAGALIQRRQLDTLAHVEGRRQQSVDPNAVYDIVTETVDVPVETAEDGTVVRTESRTTHRDVSRAVHGSLDYTLTDWERNWIRARVVDTLRDRLLARQEHAPVLDESPEAHEARELDARAKDYFGGTHAETRAGFEQLRANHKKLHDNAHLIKHRPDPDSALAPISAEAAAEIRAQHAQTIAQIDSYIEPVKGLIDRHIATVKVEVGEKRRIAQLHIDDCAKVLEVPFENVVATYTALVEAEIRAHVAPQE